MGVGTRLPGSLAHAHAGTPASTTRTCLAGSLRGAWFSLLLLGGGGCREIM
jgi:hypothetical protein